MRTGAGPRGACPLRWAFSEPRTVVATSCGNEASEATGGEGGAQGPSRAPFEGPEAPVPPGTRPADAPATSGCVAPTEEDRCLCVS